MRSTQPGEFKGIEWPKRRLSFTQFRPRGTRGRIQSRGLRPRINKRYTLTNPAQSPLSRIFTPFSPPTMAESYPHIIPNNLLKPARPQARMFGFASVPSKALCHRQRRIPSRVRRTTLYSFGISPACVLERFAFYPILMCVRHSGSVPSKALCHRQRRIPSRFRRTTL